jgi:hypothetical protein
MTGDGRPRRVVQRSRARCRSSAGPGFSGSSLQAALRQRPPVARCCFSHVHLHEARGVPDLGAEIAAQVRTCRRRYVHVLPVAVSIIRLNRSASALYFSMIVRAGRSSCRGSSTSCGPARRARCRGCRPLRTERSPMNSQPAMTMRATQKKIISDAVAEVVGRVVEPVQVGVVVRPAEYAEGPEPRRKPRVEHILVLPDLPPPRRISGHASGWPRAAHSWPQASQ